MMKALGKNILVVDDDRNVRMTVAMLLEHEGYSVATAENGFDALLHMKAQVPDLVISDLNMPQMSGFELLSVIRRRFPAVLVVAMSGAYEVGEGVPGGVIADAFHAKGGPNPMALVGLVGELFLASGEKKSAPARQIAPVWVPRNTDSSRTPYIVLTCTECLRSFPQNIPTEGAGAVMEVPCVFCLNEVQYVIDATMPSAASSTKIGTAAGGGSHNR